MTADHRGGGSRLAAAGRVGATVVSVLVVESIVCGLAAWPVVVFWRELVLPVASHRSGGPLLVSLLLVPSYAAFAICLMVASALATRITGARTAPDAAMPIADLSWPLMRWARGMVATHVVRVLAGTCFRGSPIWTAYLRLSGARIGRRVYVNTLAMSDYNLLQFGDDVVIGGDVHLSGHTVEDGVVKTASVRLGPRVTVGVGAVVDIGVVVEAGCQVGALSVVPKHTVLEAEGVYTGIPARRIR